MPIGFDDPVQDVMNGWPATIRVFLDFRMGCVGCPIACFHTVDDACAEHHVDRELFLKALRDAVASRDDGRCCLAETTGPVQATADPLASLCRD